MEVNAEQSSEGIDNLRKNRDELAQQLAELKGKYRNLQAQTAFKEASLNPKHAELFLKVVGEDEDITAKAVRDFAKEYNLAPAEIAGEPPASEPQPTNRPEGQPQQPNPQASLAEMAGAGAGPTGVNPPSSPGEKMSQAQFQKLLQTDKATALRAYAEGRVATVDGNVFVDQAKQQGVIE